MQVIDLARERKAKVFGIVGRDGGHTKQVGDVVVVIPPVSDKNVTPHSEDFQAVVWHCLVSHLSLLMEPTKWSRSPFWSVLSQLLNRISSARTLQRSSNY